MSKNKLYVAYGSNLNLEQMKHRCPMSKLRSIGVIKGYELQFKGRPNGAYLTIGKVADAETPVAVWEITPQDERFLDRYEGYPSHYYKKNIDVELENGTSVKAMVYIMNPKMKFGLPSESYYHTVYKGYKDCGIDVKHLNQALKISVERYYEEQNKEIEQAVKRYFEEQKNGNFKVYVADENDVVDDEINVADSDEDIDQDESFEQGMGWN